MQMRLQRENLDIKSSVEDLIFPSARTLFLTNIPVNATECDLLLFFKYTGTGGQEVQQGNSSSSGEYDEGKKDKKDESAPPSVILLLTVPLWTLHKTEPSGLAHYHTLCDAQHPPLDIVRAHTDIYHKGEVIMNEDRFTLVTHGGVYGQTVGGGVSIASKQFNSTRHIGSKKKKKPKEKDSFYAFQKAEKQWKTIMNLKKSFEVDKA
ncbi:hypothetical protein J3A83DRAFT_4358690 [Scleroderma citrinum]